MTTLFPIEDDAVHCAECGKLLTDPVSRARGVGPVCCPAPPKHRPVADHPVLPGFGDSMFHCAECGGEVRPAKGIGRTLGRFAVPDDINVPTCSRCGETYWDDELSEAVTDTLESLLREAMGLLADNHDFVARAERALERA